MAEGSAASTALNRRQLASVKGLFTHCKHHKVRKQQSVQAEVPAELLRVDPCVHNEDPYVEPGFTRPALHEALDVVIVGGGFGGLLAAARLQKAGITNIRIIEKAGDFGGTWYWNRYPGAQCDIESYVYLPLLEETGYIPKEKYSFAPEIFEHAQRIGKHFNLYERACF